ncbi:MAG: hemolysin family protein [Tenericutes bacterium]|jgi:putative hemolysin|nr:hemolysin family protein [Mycoplasmatota bacterium]
MWLVLQAQVNISVIFVMLVLIMVSAFFSSTETAYSSVGRLRLKTLVELRKPGSKKALWIVDNFDKTLTTLLVGNNLANISLATVSVIFFSDLFIGITDASTKQTVVALMNTGVMTIIILIFGEIIPKSLAKSNAEKFSLRMSKFIFLLIKLMIPLTYLFIILNRKVTTRIQPDKRISVTESDLETIIDTMEEEGAIQMGEADMLQSVLELSDINVEEIMTPRVDMVAIEVNQPVKEIKAMFFKNKFSRIPVYDEHIDNIIGVLSERDFYTKILKKQVVNLRRMVRPALFIPTSSKVDSLISLLQNKNTHLAIVVDEYGGVDGIVTMEDALEELVGEIYDEHDDVIETITKKDNYNYLINADFDLEDLFEDLNLGKPPVSDSTSVGGWLFEMFQDIPEIDEEIEYEVKYNQEYDELSELINEDKATLIFKILKVKKRRIKSVLMSIKVEDSGEL